MAIISCGVFDKKYFFLFLAFFFTMLLLMFSLGIVYGENGNSIQNAENFNNYLLILLIGSFGQIFCFIPELILKNYLLDKKEKRKKRLLDLFKKEKKNVAIEYIFNDLSDNISIKDIVLIFIGSILIIIADFLKILVQAQNSEQRDQLILNEHYNFLLLILIVIFSFLIYKIRFYKHQILSVIIIILLGIFRYILKIYHYYYENFEEINLYLQLFLQFIIASIESIVIIYIKGLMEYKFFSPFKVCYTFGLIISTITFTLLIIFSFIKREKSNSFFHLYYQGYYYLDNIKSIIDVYGYKLFGLFAASIFYGILQLLVNYTINKYTVCHIFLLLQNREATTNIFKELTSQNKLTFYILLSISYFIEFFVILVFLEIIELNFCDLNKNIRRSIKDRAELETRESLKDLINKNENLVERNDSVETLSEDDNI